MCCQDRSAETPTSTPTNRSYLNGRHVTPREMGILRLLVQGKANNEIAYSLGITEGTTKVYMSRMFDKFDCENRIQLALKFVRSGIDNA